MSSLNDNLRRLGQEMAEFASRREPAEVMAQQVNHMISRLREGRRITPYYEIRGRIVHSIDHAGTYLPEGEVYAPSWCEYLVAGIRGDGGVGAFSFVVMEGDNWPDNEEERTYTFIPFSDLPSEAQAKFADEIPRLLDELTRSVT